MELLFRSVNTFLTLIRKLYTKYTYGISVKYLKKGEIDTVDGKIEK